ncbi:MAG: aerotolerance regulator BatA [Acidobacteria bacterium]|nr:MAG: aerotolerance regulator BatA [Acidobacteriota bacterium]
MFRFESWAVLFLLIPVIFLIWWLVKQNRAGREGIRFSGFLMDLVPVSPREYLFRVAAWFPLVALVLMVLALARPQLGKLYERQDIKGIDIVLCLDISSSMKAMDLKPNRFQVAKETLLSFVDGRPYDRMGYIPFSAYAITRCPLTTDHKMLKQLIADTKLGSIEDGTAIGMAIATAVNRLRKSKAKSKVIILATDGMNNRGNIDPRSAAELAEALGIRIYADGVGTTGYAEMPQPGPFGTVRTVKVLVQIDENMLKEITGKTGGAYFRATNAEKLKAIYSIIDRMEKTKIEVKKFALWRDIYSYFLWSALALMLGFFFVREIVLRVKQ